MNVQPGKWNRRQFLQASAIVAATAATGRAATTSACAGRPLYAIAAARSPASGNLLQSFLVNDREWHARHTLPVGGAGHISMHPTLPVAYVCHALSLWDYLPRGAVSAYRVDTATGTLQCMGTQPLSLGAMHPQHAVVTAHGRSLVVLTRSGIYNVLPLAENGALLPVTAIRKEYGRTTDAGSRSAAPMHAVQHADGSLLAVDPGQAMLSRFHVEAKALPVRQRLEVHAAAGAREVALSPCGRWAYTLHAHDASLAVHQVTADAVVAAHQVMPGPPGRAAMLLSPDGGLLVRAGENTVSVLPLDRHTGHISTACSTVIARLDKLAWTPDGGEVVGFDAASGAVTALPVHAASHALGEPRTVASISGCTSLAFCLA